MDWTCVPKYSSGEKCDQNRVEYYKNGVKRVLNIVLKHLLRAYLGLYGLYCRST